jgi:NitT/TauT family transport system substrate-binding protein
MALRDNVLTPEVRANGLGAVDMARLEESIGQIAVGYTFKGRPWAEAVFDPAFLPPLAERRPN